MGDNAGLDRPDYPVEFVADGPGRAAIRTDVTCNTRETLWLQFSVRGRTVVIKDASTNGCLVNRALAADLAALTLRLLPQP